MVMRRFLCRDSIAGRKRSKNTRREREPGKPLHYFGSSRDLVAPICARELNVRFAVWHCAGRLDSRRQHPAMLPIYRPRQHKPWLGPKPRRHRPKCLREHSLFQERQIDKKCALHSGTAGQILIYILTHRPVARCKAASFRFLFSC